MKYRYKERQNTLSIGDYIFIQIKGYYDLWSFPGRKTINTYHLERMAENMGKPLVKGMI